MLPSTLSSEERVSTLCMLSVAETVPRGGTVSENCDEPGPDPEINTGQRRRWLFLDLLRDTSVAEERKITTSCMQPGMFTGTGVRSCRKSGCVVGLPLPLRQERRRWLFFA